MNFNLVGLLHKNSLSLFVLGNKGFEEIKIDFPEEVVTKSDIFDTDKFSFELKNQLIRRPELKGSEILFLIPEEKIFSKMAQIKGTTLEEEKGKFWAEAPVSEEESHLGIQTKNGWVQFISVPKKLVTDIENSLAKVGFKAQVLPLAQLVAMGFGGKEKTFVGFRLQDHFNLLVCQNGFAIRGLEVDLEKKDEESVLGKISKIRGEAGMEDLGSLVLLNEEKELASEIEETGLKVRQSEVTGGLFQTLFKILADNRNQVAKSLVGNSIKTVVPKFKFPFKKIISMVLIIFLLFTLVGLFIFFKDLGSKIGLNVKEEQVETPTATPVPTKVASQEAQPVATQSGELSTAALNKNSFKVMVINGNGLPGDAGRFEKVLNLLGFTNSDTDTADVQGQRVTTLSFSSKVPASYQQQVQDAVEKEYVQVKLITNPSSGIDIEISLGAKK